jgi:DNA-binding transcriptional ArsR family regulator
MSGPAGDVHLDARNLRGLAHPLRVEALGWLRRHGPATATSLGAALGQSSGAMSYHLRQLAQYGFVVEDEGHGSGRERWWRAAHRSTILDAPLFAGTPRLDEAAVAAAGDYLRAVGRTYAERITRFTDQLETFGDDLGPEWEEGSTLSDWPLRLTPERAKRLVAELEDLANRYRDEPDDGPRARAVALQIQVLPLREDGR